MKTPITDKWFDESSEMYGPTPWSYGFEDYTDFMRSGRICGHRRYLGYGRWAKLNIEASELNEVHEGDRRIRITQ